MKQTIDSLLFAILFALVVASIGLSVRPMIRLAAQMPATAAKSTLRSLPPVTPRLVGTPTPAGASRGVRPAARLSS